MYTKFQLDLFSLCLYFDSKIECVKATQLAPHRINSTGAGSLNTGGRSTGGGGAAYTAALRDLLLGLLVWTSTTKFGGDMDHRCSPKVAKKRTKLTLSESRVE